MVGGNVCFEIEMGLDNESHEIHKEARVILEKVCLAIEKTKGVGRITSDGAGL